MNKSTMNMVIKAIDQATPTLRKIGKGFGTLKSTAGRLGGGLKSALTTIGRVGAVVTGAVGGALLYAIKQASDFNETLSKTKVVLGTAADEVIKFAEGAADSLGMSNTEALDAASTFAIFGKSANLSGDSLAGFATNLTTLAADFGSFYNASNEDAITAIGAALRGESEPIRKFGVLLNDATLKNRAFSMGLIKTTKGALTPQNKVLAAQAEILAQAAKTGAVGDFQRTLGSSLPNQLKKLRANFDKLTTSLGTEFLPIATDVVSWVGKDIVPQIKKALPEIKQFAKGFVDAGGAIASKLLPALGNAAKGLADTFGPMIQDNIENMTKPGGVFDSVGKVMGPIFDTIGDSVGGLIAKLTGPGGLLTALGNVIGTLWGDGKGPLATAVGAIGNILGLLIDTIANIAGAIAGLITAVDDFLKAFGKASDVSKGASYEKYNRMAGNILPAIQPGTRIDQYGVPIVSVKIGEKSVDGIVLDALGRQIGTTTSGR
jgi:hypothetical protein